VAGRARDRASTKKPKKDARVRRRRVRLLWFVAIVGIAAYLYYRPLASYLETRNDLAAARTEVESLRVARDQLALRLVNSKSLDATQREARRIGYVKPGEQMFVVKGIPAWRKARSGERERS
jgi:cell division protein FtsB